MTVEGLRAEIWRRFHSIDEERGQSIWEECLDTINEAIGMLTDAQLRDAGNICIYYSCGTDGNICRKGSVVVDGKKLTITSWHKPLWPKSEIIGPLNAMKKEAESCDFCTVTYFDVKRLEREDAPQSIYLKFFIGKIREDYRNSF